MQMSLTIFRCQIPILQVVGCRHRSTSNLDLTKKSVYVTMFSPLQENVSGDNLVTVSCGPLTWIERCGEIPLVRDSVFGTGQSVSVRQVGDLEVRAQINEAAQLGRLSMRGVM